MDDARNTMGAQRDARKKHFFARVIHRVLREMMALVVGLLYLGHRFGRHLLRTEFQTQGECKKRGACCHHVLVEWSPWIDRHPLAARLVLWKLTRFYSFFDRGYTWEIEDGLMARVLGCHALQEDGSCGEYRLRPFFCRTYPEMPLFGAPSVLRGCGYHFRRRDGENVEPLIQLGRRAK